MILNVTVSGVVAVIAGYLIGGIPSAYIATRLLKKQDIRRIGTGHTGVGNVGARNVFVNVGRVPGVIVAIFDITKGAATVVLAEWLLGWPSTTQLSPATLFALAAGLAAVIGHIWPLYINFRGGAGLATSLGVMALFMTNDLFFGLGIALLLIVITRNVILSANMGLLTVPAWAWLMGRQWWMVVYPLVILAVMFAHFLPNIVAEVKKAGNFDRLLASLTRRDKTGTK